MEYRQLGRTGLKVSVLGVGLSAIGFAGTPAITVRRLLSEAVDHGLTVFDTAECYPGSEEVIGETLPSSVRTSVVLMTKCGHEDGAADWSAASLGRTITRSLTRLRTDFVDVMFLHGCSEEQLLRGEAIETLDDARRRGDIRFLGYSGDGAAALAAARSGRFDVLEMSLNVADLDALAQLVPEAGARNLGVVAKRPLANGVWRSATEPASSYHRPYWDRLRRLDYPFAADRSDDAASIALRFTVTVPGVHTAIVGTTQPDRIGQNVAALDEGPLPPAEMQAIFDRWRTRSDPSWCGLD